MPPAHHRDSGKGKGECPRRAAQERQRRYRKATQLPGQDCREEIQHADSESGGNEEVPIRAIESLHVEVNGTHRANQSIDSPCRIGLMKGERVDHRKEEQENSSDSIKQGCFHGCLLPNADVARIGT